MATESILNQEAEVNKGEIARMASFVGAIAIADMVKTTLGPKGMDKILQSVSDRNGRITVTNDGATILRSIYVDNAAAKVLVDIAKTQDDEVGDGTTSVAVLCGELLREAERLINQRIHPQTIVEGWRKSTQIARQALEKSAMDNSGNDESFREDLLNIARTTLSSKLLTHEKEHFAQLAVEAVLRIRETGNLEHIHILKKPGGTLAESFLSDGFILDKKIGLGQPKRIENAKILLANTFMDYDKIKMNNVRIRSDSMLKVVEVEQAEKQKMRNKVENIIKHGINCFINRQLIYNFPEEIFADNGVMAIELADFIGVERLGAVTGGEVVSTFDSPEGVKLGECELIEEIMIGEDKLIKFSGCKVGAACTLVLRGASSHILEEAERSIHDALCVLTQTIKETRTICGGGCSEIAMAQAIDNEVVNVPGKKAIAMEAFARALRQMPAIIADNGGYDSSDLVSQLRVAHANGQTTFGLDMYNGIIANMQELGIRESFKSKLQVLLSASEAAEMILRVDEIIKCAPRRRDEEPY